MGIPNIHVVRDSSNKIARLCDVYCNDVGVSTQQDTSDMDCSRGCYQRLNAKSLHSSTGDEVHSNGGICLQEGFLDVDRDLFGKVLETGWLDHISAILAGALATANLVLESSATGIPVAIITHCR